MAKKIEYYCEKKGRGTPKSKQSPNWEPRKPAKKGSDGRENPPARRSHTNGK